METREPEICRGSIEATWQGILGHPRKICDRTPGESVEDSDDDDEDGDDDDDDDDNDNDNDGDDDDDNEEEA